jgi:hypothetical protein
LRSRGGGRAGAPRRGARLAAEAVPEAGAEAAHLAAEEDLACARRDDELRRRAGGRR